MKKFFPSAFALLLPACVVGAIEEDPEGEVAFAYPDQSGEIRTAVLETINGPREMTYEVIEGVAVFEGDIILGTEEEIAELELPESALEGIDPIDDTAPPSDKWSDVPDWVFEEMEAEEIAALEEIDEYTFEEDYGEDLPEDLSDNVRSFGVTGRTWPRGVVYYEISRKLPNKRRVFQAIQHWRKKTPLRFVKRTDQENYIRFVPGKGCSSYVGRIGGPQKIRLARGCRRAQVIHEIGHAVGLWHEQSRSDRKNHIQIFFRCIRGGKKHNFRIRSGRKLSPYDIRSRMHYRPRSFLNRKATRANGKPCRKTIRARKGWLRPMRILSPRDIAGVKKRYAKQTQ